MVEITKGKRHVCVDQDVEVMFVSERLSSNANWFLAGDLILAKKHLVLRLKQPLRRNNWY